MLVGELRVDLKGGRGILVKEQQKPTIRRRLHHKTKQARL